MMTTTAPVRLVKVSAFAYLAPTAAIVSSFGARTERGALLISLESACGQVGWGEVWCGMPAAGALHRLALFREFAAQALVGAVVEDIQTIMMSLATRLAPVETLAGEPGPVAQLLAGIDSALWDLKARCAGVPLYALLGGHTPRMRCYASGIAPDASERYLDELRAQGYRAFKFKAGFDDAATLPLLLRQRQSLLPGEAMMIDANCGWDTASAQAALSTLNTADLEWIEEPVRPDTPDDAWKALASATPIALAGGENLYRRADFDRAATWLRVIQPDLAKWGGVSGVLHLGKDVEARGLNFCPHSFGTHIAAITSAHVLAAAGGRGYLELDVNRNLLRHTTSYAGWIVDGVIQLPDTPGIGVTPSADMQPYLRDSVIVES